MTAGPHCIKVQSAKGRSCPTSVLNNNIDMYHFELQDDYVAYTVEPGLYDSSSITSDILWYQLIPHC
jgi:hypothetical protein